MLVFHGTVVPGCSGSDNAWYRPRKSAFSNIPESSFWSADSSSTGRLNETMQDNVFMSIKVWRLWSRFVEFNPRRGYTYQFCLLFCSCAKMARQAIYFPCLSHTRRIALAYGRFPFCSIYCRILVKMTSGEGRVIQCIRSLSSTSVLPEARSGEFFYNLMTSPGDLLCSTLFLI